MIASAQPTTEDLLARIRELDTLLVELRREKDQQEALLEDKCRRLAELTRIDSLTNVYNRRTLFEMLDMEIRRSKRSLRPLSVIIIDIDHLTRVNERYGLVVGDDLLASTAQTIKDLVRGTDIVGRYGGEEFLLILPDCTVHGALHVGEKVRLAIQAATFPPGLKITVSGGVAQYAHISCDALLESASRALAEAKNAGRNCMVYSNWGR